MKKNVLNLIAKVLDLGNLLVRDLAVETSFYIPTKDDSSKQDHDDKKWADFEQVLTGKFGAFTRCSNVNGIWTAPNGTKIQDESREYRLAIKRHETSTIKNVLGSASSVFGQQSIYFKHGYTVELINPTNKKGGNNE
jgi:hypothetical protein